MSDIFLSYASEDRERVGPLAEALIQEGWSVFWDRVIPVGKTWHEMLEEELSAARSLLIVWSENSIKSKWVREEADEGLRMELPLFPILLDEVLPPLGFRGIQAADFSAWDGSLSSQVFKNLVQGIKGSLGQPGTPPPGLGATELEPSGLKPPGLGPPGLEEPEQKPPGPRESRKNRARLIGGLAGLALLLLMVGLWWSFQNKSQEKPIVKTGRLFVETTPKEATVKLINPPAKFTQGIELKPGKYQVEVSADSYKTEQKWIEIEDGTKKTISFDLIKNARLYVDTLPKDATVKLQHIPAKFVQGMELKPGRYELEVSAENHETKREAVELEAGEKKYINITLTEKKARLWVNTEPKNAKVRIPNFQFTQGMELKPGKYQVEVSADGYKTEQKWIEIEDGTKKTINFDLIKNARLYVDTKPKDATVRLLHIPAKFVQGMELEPGRYELEVSAGNHETKREAVELEAGDRKYISITLTKVKARLWVDTEPKNAKVRIPNFQFAQGVKLEPGRYEVEVSAENYEAKRQEVKLSPGEDKRVLIVLTKAKPKKDFTNSIGMKFVLVPAGTFQMGSTKDEQPDRGDDERQHWVTISRPFYLQTTEVTQGQYQRVMRKNPSHFHGENRPVERVSWDDAQKFIKKLNQMEKTDKYRLPTEAEWEYACRAGSTTRFCFGDDEAKLGEYAWYGENSGSKTRPVKQKKPNAWGLFDMHGNVYEWCQDWYGEYPAGPVTDPTGPASGRGRVLRGGSWYFDARCARSALRNYNRYPGFRDCNIGFRVARAF